MTSISLRRRSDPCYLIPDLKSLLTFGAVLLCLELMAPRIEMFSDGAKGR